MTDYEPTRLFAGLSQTAPAPRLIVCERTGEWSTALRVELAESGVRLWECRRLAEAWSALGESTGAFVIAEATRENLAELLERLSWLDRDFPLVRAAAVAERGLAQYEWPVREAGAVHFSDFASTPGAAGPAGSPAPGERAGAGAVACAADLGDTTLAAAGRVEWLPPCRCLSPNPPSAMSCPDFRTPKPAAGRMQLEQIHSIELRDGKLAVTLGLTTWAAPLWNGNRRGTGGHAAEPLSRHRRSK